MLESHPRHHKGETDPQNIEQTMYSDTFGFDQFVQGREHEHKDRHFSAKITEHFEVIFSGVSLSGQCRPRQRQALRTAVLV